MNYIGLKNILFILLATVIIGGALVFSNYKSSLTPVTSSANQNLFQAVTSEVATSSVGAIAYDANWQKTLSKISDASSSWTSAAATDDTGYFTPGQTVSGATAFLGKDLFARYIAAKQNGYDTSATDTQETIVGQTLADGTLLLSPKVYDDTSFTIVSDNSPAAVTKYGNDLGRIFKTSFAVKHRNELTIVQDSLNQNNPATLKELDPIITNYQVVMKSLLALQTPSTLADFHKDLVNAISELIFADQNLTKTYSDGVTSLQGASVFQQASIDLRSSIYALASYFVTAGISFGSNDPGSLFTIQI